MKPDRDFTPPGLLPGVFPHVGWWDAAQKMANRMAVSEQKYGGIEDNYPQADALATLHQRLGLYAETGNTEWLLDAANMAMIEYLRPSHGDAHFRATDSDESPGIVGLLSGEGTCPTCDGEGLTMGYGRTHRCERCGGSGVVIAP
jgi:hypothetical protein